MFSKKKTKNCPVCHLPQIGFVFQKIRKKEKNIKLVDLHLHNVCIAAELGDYDEELDCHHLEMKQYVPNQEYLDHKIIKFHKKHR